MNTLCEFRVAKARRERPLQRQGMFVPGEAGCCETISELRWYRDFYRPLIIIIGGCFLFSSGKVDFL